MSWIQTFTGRQFFPLQPRAEDICIEDVAHALSLMCRYTGHTRSFYSVAQHCVIASNIVPPEDARWALLHDAAEAYLADIARPIKGLLPGIKEIEARIEAAVAERFGLALPMPDSIKRADLVLLATERRDLMSAPPAEWTAIEGIEPLPERIAPWPPHIGECLFMRQFQHLFGDEP